MKKLAAMIEVENEGFLALMGQKVLIFCMNYIYTGTLTGINDAFVKIEGARIVYETGAFDQANYKDAQALPGTDWYIQIAAVESFGISK